MNLEHTHTPGPWVARIIRGAWHVVRCPDDGGIESVAISTSASPQREHANVRLIAAAPEVLKELERAYCCIRQSLAEMEDSMDEYADYHVNMQQFNAAYQRLDAEAGRIKALIHKATEEA